MGRFISTIKLTVDNIIAISELESGFIHFKKKKNSLNELIEESLKEVSALKSSHTIILDLPPQPVFLSFDFDLLKLALKNLLINAIEYSEEAKPILIRFQILSNAFQLSVLDEGPGVPTEILPLIFDKFYQAPGTKKELGLGLGLAIVKSVVEIHQGKIELKPREEWGTEFSLILPF